MAFLSRFLTEVERTASDDPTAPDRTDLAPAQHSEVEPGPADCLSILLIYNFTGPAGPGLRAILEKLEGEIKDNSGKASKIYIMGVARDGWGKSSDNQWTLLWSKQLGQQRWQESPPIGNW